MKNLALLLFCTIVTFCYAQKKSPVKIGLTGGISSPLSNFSDHSFASSGSFFELSSAYYFSKFGIGISIGQFSNPTENNFTEFTDQLNIPVSNTFEDWKTTYYGIGPNVNFDFGSIETVIYARYGQMSTKAISLSGNYEIENADVSKTVPIYNLDVSDKVSASYYSAGIKLGYKINPNFSFYITSNLISSTSEDLEIENKKANFQDLDGDGVISEQEILKLVAGDIEYSTSTTFSKLSAVNYGFGLSYSFGKRPAKIGGTEKPYARENENLNNQDTSIKRPVNSGSVVFINPSKKNKKRQQKIIGVLPKNNSIFKNADEINKFTWEVIGAKISNPQFIIEITKINNNQQPQRTYVEKTSKTSLGATRIFKENKISDGQYRWKVIETTTGNSSDVKFFTFSNCDIDFSITNEEIKCLGYEGEDRKFKICFDATYTSPSGDLTYANPLSGLSVYDQTYASLSYTLVSPNPALITQVGASPSTVSYCFEVTVSNSVTSIGFGLQGDDLDPSPIVCQPGASLIIDELPDCICDECEEIELTFDDFSISPNGGTGNHFNFNGNINVNVPIYGIEFQIQSYSYTASPSACSEGVSSVEESGMLLMPGTTINGSSSLQLVNETASGSAGSNDNATKNIKYTSNSPISGAIPVNLTIGLPGPISGLDPSCCTIDYTVCVKVKVFYEESNCKSCVFTHCFNFNNQ